MNAQLIDRTASIGLVLDCLREVLELADEPVPADLGEDSVLVGGDAVIDSLGVVALVVEIEQRLEVDYSLSLTLASDKAMSEKNSPFRTVAVLADYVVTLAREAVQ